MRRLLLAAFALVMLAGCQQYYRVIDPQTNRIYYTRDVDRTGSGAVTLTDDRDGDIVTLQNSEIEKITEQQYDNGVRGLD